MERRHCCIKRDVSTVPLGTAEGSPIHRQQHDRLGSVYAFRPELDAWRAARSHGPEEEHGDPTSGHDATVASVPEIRVGSDPVRGPAVSHEERGRWGRHAATGVVAIVVIGLALWLFSRQPGTGPRVSRPAIRSIVVLPLENLSGDVAQEYFTAGLTEELTARLAQLKTLRVVSRTSAISRHARLVSTSRVVRRRRRREASSKNGRVRFQSLSMHNRHPPLGVTSKRGPRNLCTSEC